MLSLIQPVIQKYEFFNSSENAESSSLKGGIMFSEYYDSENLNSLNGIGLERFKDLAVPVGLVYRYNNPPFLQMGGDKETATKYKESAPSTIPCDIFESIFSNVRVLTNSQKRSNNGTKKHIDTGVKQKYTKKRRV